ncbi:MAG: hypothetical protein QOI80_1069 [Solirubrobacteraceae bacterium]|nr:hypothetical protein [Solirubrobacteraceae bacterium]
MAALVWMVAFRTGHGQAADLSGLERLGRLQGTRGETVADIVAGVCNEAPYAVLAVIVTVVALTTRGKRGAAVVAAILIVPNVVTQLLKTTTAENRVDFPPTPIVHVEAASWPSGHATAAMALALACVIAAPAALRVIVACAGLAFAAAVGVAVVALGWHFPSDVAGGYLVATTGGCLGAAVLSRRETTVVRGVRWHPARG